MSIPMEVGPMEKGKGESHLISPVAFVEGGIQEACDDSCSICLEAFCDSDPSTVTSCKHEFHLQCILEWCQRSSNCPMCWQAISLKDPTSQELLEAVEQERRFRFNPTRNSTIFRHPTLGDFELQNLPVGVNEGELDDRIIQHLVAAAAMGRTQHVGRRGGSRNLNLNRPSSAHGQPQFLVFSARPNAPSAATAEPSVSGGVGGVRPTPPLGMSNNQQGTSVIRRSSSSQSYLSDQDRAGPSDLQAVTDSWRSRLNAMSMRYKESLAKSTTGWKERLFNKSPSMSDIDAENNTRDHDSSSSSSGGADTSAAAGESRRRNDNN